MKTTFVTFIKKPLQVESHKQKNLSVSSLLFPSPCFVLFLCHLRDNHYTFLREKDGNKMILNAMDVVQKQ